MDESKLLFIVSQPRSGSTLTQKLLSNNAHVDTVSEPWLLLPLLSIFKPDIIEAQYNYPVALNGFFDFLKKRKAEEDFREGLKKLVLNLYKVNGESRYFIDKTPRYYEILPEIARLFPRARFLVLKRNPFAALHSMLSTWSGGKINYDLFQSFYRDFLVAPFLIQKFCDEFSGMPNFYSLKYETLVQDPGGEVNRTYDWLGIPFRSDVLNIAENDKVRGIYGDDVYRNKPLTTVISNGIDAWKGVIGENAALSTFFGEYQDYLSADFLAAYGYEKHDFKKVKWRLGKTRFQRFLSSVKLDNTTRVSK